MCIYTDEAFVHAFFQGSLFPAPLHHRDHLRVAWYLVREYDLETALGLMSQGLRALANRMGKPAVYHETLTRFWVSIILHAASLHADLDSFDAFLATCPQLLDKQLPYAYWRPETLDGPQARAEWVAPDMQPLPIEEALA